MRFTKLCWVGKHINIIMKPTNSRTQGQANPRKIRLKVAAWPLFPTANPPHAVSLESSPSFHSKTMGLYSNHEKSRNHEMPGQATAGQLQAASLSVRVIYPVCQHRSVLCPLGVPNHAIHQTVLLIRCFPQSELVSQIIRTNAKLCVQQPSDHSFSIGPRAF